jgi:hypothetical protein
VDAQVEVRGQEEMPEGMKKLLGAARPPAGQEQHPAASVAEFLSWGKRL